MLVNFNNSVLSTTRHHAIVPFEENSYNDSLDDTSNIDETVAKIVAEMERRNTLGYGLGVCIGRLIGTRNDCDSIQSNESLFSGLVSHLQAGYSSVKKITYKLISNFKGYSEVHIALFNEDLNHFREVVSRSHYINSADANGFTPAYYAILDGNVPALEILLDMGLPLESYCSPTKTLLGVAFKQKNHVIIRYLLSREAEIHTALSLILKYNDVKSLKYLLKQKHDLTYIFNRVLTANKIKLLQALLKYAEINLNAISVNGLLPLDYAIIHNQFEIADLLKKYGANASKEPIIALVTNNDKNGRFYLEAQDFIYELSTNEKVVTITPPLNLVNPAELQSKLSTLLSQLDSCDSSPKAILNSGIEEVERIKEYVENVFKYVDGIWLSGGVNVWRDWYSNSHTCEDPQDLLRDVFEIAILDYQQRRQNLPLIGICRGHQMINVFYGGTLQDQGDQRITSVKYQTDKGILGVITPTITLGKSNHKQSIDRLAPNLEAVMVSEEGMIKAIQSKEDDLILMGTQFHPEYHVPHNERGLSPSEIRDLRQSGMMVLNHFIEMVKSHKQEKCLATYDIRSIVTKILALVEPVGGKHQERQIKELFEMLDDEKNQRLAIDYHSQIFSIAFRNPVIEIFNRLLRIPGMIEAVGRAPDFLDRAYQNGKYLRSYGFGQKIMRDVTERAVSALEFHILSGNYDEVGHILEQLEVYARVKENPVPFLLLAIKGGDLRILKKIWEIAPMTSTVHMIEFAKMINQSHLLEYLQSRGYP